MLNIRKTSYGGVLVTVLEARSDARHEVVLTVMGDKFSTSSKKLLPDFHDLNLESQGFTRFGLVNGGLFFKENSVTYAEGIEQVNGVIHENDDANLDSCMAFYIQNGMPYIVPQLYAKSKLSQSKGALTGAFGLLNNEVIDTRGRLQRSAIFNAKSGRSIVGKKADGTIVLASFPGVTGSSGLTGMETANLAKSLGMNNAVCMDGGGSVGMFTDKWEVQSSRPIKNAVGLFYKNKLSVGDKVSLSDTVESINGNLVKLKSLGITVDITKVTEE